MTLTATNGGIVCVPRHFSIEIHRAGHLVPHAFSTYVGYVLAQGTYLTSYYNLSSVTLFVCALTTRKFHTIRRVIFMRESQGGSPIGKALVYKM